MTYKREDDRYFRSQLQEIQDGLQELSGVAGDLRVDLHNDDSVTTANARYTIAVALNLINAASMKLAFAATQLLAPAVGHSEHAGR